MTVADVEWEPGIPLYDGRSGTHSRYLFNFREDTDSVDCYCGDAAVWTADPAAFLPPSARQIIGEDELANFIRQYHAWVEAGRPEVRS